VHDREDLAPLPDQSEPLGPGRDESRRRSVHWPVASSRPVASLRAFAAG